MSYVMKSDKAQKQLEYEPAFRVMEAWMDLVDEFVQKNPESRLAKLQKKEFQYTADSVATFPRLLSLPGSLITKVLI